MKEKNRCEFCGEMEICESTTFVGNYCIECHKILIEQSREAIKIIKTDTPLKHKDRGR